MDFLPLAVDKFNDRSKHWRTQTQAKSLYLGLSANAQVACNQVPARAKNVECFDGSLNLSINDEFTRKFERIHRTTYLSLSALSRREIKEINAVYI